LIQKEPDQDIRMSSSKSDRSLLRSPALHNQDQKHCTFPALDFLCATASLLERVGTATPVSTCIDQGIQNILVSVLDLE
jgi:hypothetical protein